MSRISRAIVILSVLVGSLAPARAQDAGWVGKKVITKGVTPLRVEDRVTDDGSTLYVYKVTHEQGGLLWLEVEGRGIAGWGAASEVIPFDQAIDYYTQAIRANPGEFANYFRRGWVWFEKGEYDIALADYNEAIRLNPAGASTWNNRGNVWKNKKDYDKAIADYNEAIRIDPKHTHAYLCRGIAWSDKKDYEKAIADYNEAIRIDPKHTHAYLCRGVAWYLKKDYDKAIADYNEAIRIDPKHAMAFNNRGNAWSDKKDFDQAIADYNEAIRIDPKHAMAFNNRGVAWSDKKDFDQAIADYNEAIRIDPKYADTYNNRALLWATCPDARLRDGKRAVESATKACELSDWKEANSIGTLAASYAEAGEFDKAVKHQIKANGLYSDKDAVTKGEARLKLYREKKPYRDE